MLTTPPHARAWLRRGAAVAAWFSAIALWGCGSRGDRANGLTGPCITNDGTGGANADAATDGLDVGDAATNGSAADSAVDAGTPVVPTGARCAATKLQSLADLPIGTPCAGTVAEFSPARPLGVGFPDNQNMLPPHVAYLTFDDGPSDWTGEILDTLAAKQVHATFFINAKNFKGSAGLDGTYLDAKGTTHVFREVIVRMADEGHVLANHTVDHLDLASLTPANAAAELDDNERFINIALVQGGRSPRPLTFIRPPWGSPWYHHTPLPPDQVAAETAVANVVAARGLDIMWTLDSTDSREWAQGETFTRRPGQITPDPTAPTYADKVARIQQSVLTDPQVLAGTGVVILMHDTHNATRDALASVIDGLRAGGYSFGTIEELALWRWLRPSIDLVPGPGLYDGCTSQGDWGCGRVNGSSVPVCGRFWQAYNRLGATSVLGVPTAKPQQRNTGAGVLYQPFASGTIELHPELPSPCDVLIVGQ